MTPAADEKRAKRAWPLDGSLEVCAIGIDDARRLSDSQTMTYTVPGPPVPKGRPRFTKTGRAYTPQTTRFYEAACQRAARFAVASGNWPLGGWPSAEVRYMVEINLWLEADRGDLDNAAKAALDAANGIVWPDDSRICALFVTRRVACRDQKPRAEITVTALGPTGATQ